MGWHRSGDPVVELIQEEDYGPIILPWLPDAAGACFLCHQPLGFLGPWTYWDGPGQIGGLGAQLREVSVDVFLHPACARDLAVHLIQDAYLAEGNPPMGRAAPSAPRRAAGVDNGSP